MWDERLAALIGPLQRQGRHTVLFHQTLAERVGLNATDSRTLAYLHETGSATAGELARLTGLTTGAVTGIIDRLEKGGFVRREADPSDRRRVVVVVDPESPGNREMAALFASFAREVAEMLDRYTDDELAAIRKFCEEGSDLLRRETEKLIGEE
jgi:DNA-binding MarR family transcriptional regulator